MKQALVLSLVLGLSQAVLAEEYSQWKASQGPSGAQRSFLSVSNGAVEAHVGELGTGNTGRFTIGTGAGEYLLYGHGGDPWSSYVRIRVDGLVYAPEGGGLFDVAMLPVAGPAIVGNGIVTSWSADGVMLTQTLTPVMVNGEGTVAIDYEVLNTSTYGREVSVMLEMDTMVNWNDAAPISTSNGYIAVESCYTGGQVPNTWQAFEESPTQDPSLLVGCGILNGFGATLPDFAAFGAWGNVYGGFFDFVCSGYGYGDSGCLLRWNAGLMMPGQGDSYKTFYGTCTEYTVPGELSLSLGGTTALSCQNGEIEPNPFDVNLLVTNTGGEICHDVVATVDPGAGLIGGAPVWIGDLAPGDVGAASFFITAMEPYCDYWGFYTVEVTSADCPGNVISREIWVPCCDAVNAPEQVLAFQLGAAHPNPFNPVTTLSFTMAETGAATLAVFNLAGVEVARPFNGLAERGEHALTFDASGLPSGIYLYTLSTAQGVQTRKMILTK